MWITKLSAYVQTVCASYYSFGVLCCCCSRLLPQEAPAMIPEKRQLHSSLLLQVLCVLADPVPGAQYGHLPVQNHWCPSP